jgi:hypothetical protein
MPRLARNLFIPLSLVLFWIQTNLPLSFHFGAFDFGEVLLA